MPAFLGQLRSNEIFASLYNMIISQNVFSDNINGDLNSITNQARVDGGLYGDTKIYYATDALKSKAWGNDAEATNLLKIKRPKAPEQQAIYIDVFRQITLTVDYYLSKRAWSDETSFSQFNSVMLGWIRTTKEIYDHTTYYAFLGTDESSATRGQETITINANGNSLGENVAYSIANLLDDIDDVSRDFNDYGFLRKFPSSMIKVVWNNVYVNAMKKIDLPSIFHNDDLVAHLTDYRMNHRYFGTVNTSSGTTSATNTTIRSLIENEYEVASADADPRAEYDEETEKYYVHVFGGDLLPNSVSYLANETYTSDDTIICKVLVKFPPFMSAFEVGTSFFNPKSLTENHYLTWSHNTLEHLFNYPLITIRAVESEE